MKWELVIFDNDGVLVDSERLANRVLAAILSDLGVPTTFDQSVATYLGGTIERVRTLVEATSGRRLPDDFEDRYYREVFAAFDAALVAVPGVDDVLEGLDAAGIRYCVASSGSRERIGRSLRHVGLWDHFAGHAFSAEEVASGKPAPDLFEHAAATLHVDRSKCVVIEDSPLGIQAARSADMAVIGFAAVTPADRLVGAGAIRTSMEEIRPLLLAGSPLSSVGVGG